MCYDYYKASYEWWHNTKKIEFDGQVISHIDYLPIKVNGLSSSLRELHRAGWKFYLRATQNYSQCYFYLKYPPTGIVMGRVLIDMPYCAKNENALCDNFVFQMLKIHKPLEMKYITHEKNLLKGKIKTIYIEPLETTKKAIDEFTEKDIPALYEKIVELQTPIASRAEKSIKRREAILQRKNNVALEDYKERIKMLNI